MKKIASFMVDHTKLLPGLYVSREDSIFGNTVTTFDLRLCKPNTGDVMNTGGIHATEHLVATYLRNNPQWEDKVIYFGPMGCSTGFYMILAGKYSSNDVLFLVLDCFKFVADYTGDIPGASEVECGNYRDLDLFSAKEYARRYCDVLAHATEDRLIYPN